MSDIPTDLGKGYAEAFVERCHDLLVMGYARLDCLACAELDEPVITGRLVDAIHEVLDDPMSPQWVDLFDVQDDPPVSEGGKEGKRRPRVDIQIRSSLRRPRPYYRYEAKRLNSAYVVADYLGPKGMMALLEGYYGIVASGGMIGYVQVPTLQKWVSEVQEELRSNPGTYWVSLPVTFGQAGIVTSVPMFVSTHRLASGSLMTVTHCLLPCCEDGSSEGDEGVDKITPSPPPPPSS